MKSKIVTEEHKFWNYMFYGWVCEFIVYSHIMMQQAGGV
jgi:hypothetical protein